MLGSTRASCLHFLSLESPVGDALKDRIEWLLECHAGRVQIGSRVSDEPEAVCRGDSDAAGLLSASEYLLLLLFRSCVCVMRCCLIFLLTHNSLHICPSQLWLLLQGRWSYFCARRPHQLTNYSLVGPMRRGRGPSLAMTHQSNSFPLRFGVPYLKPRRISANVIRDVSLRVVG